MIEKGVIDDALKWRCSSLGMRCHYSARPGMTAVSPARIFGIFGTHISRHIVYSGPVQQIVDAYQSAKIFRAYRKLCTWSLRYQYMDIRSPTCGILCNHHCSKFIRVCNVLQLQDITGCMQGENVYKVLQVEAALRRAESLRGLSSSSYLKQPPLRPLGRYKNPSNTYNELLLG